MADIPGDQTTTTSISLGGSLNSAIDVVGDHDWIAINLVAGQAVDIGITLGTLQDSYLTIRDSSGTEIKSDDDIIDGVNRASEVKFDPSYTGTYYIDVSAWVDPNQGQPGDSYTGTGTYTVWAKPFTPPPVATNDQIANQLISGAWGGDVHHWAVTQGGTLTVDIHTLTVAEQNIARTALSEWTDIIGVHFQEVTSGAQITFSDAKNSDGSAVAQTDANWSNGIISSAHVQISSNWVTNWSNLNSYGLQTYIHEIGHALGLGHEGNYNSGDNGNSAIQYPYDALFANDAWSTSIMSYFDQSENSYFANQGFSYAYALTPMVADIVAMQTLYGLSTTTRAGDTVYGDNSNAGGIYNAVTYPNVALTIFDSGGNDTIDYSGSGYNQLINLNPETFSNVNGLTGNLEIARGTVIENAIGGYGADTIIGNSANNVLTGNSGTDTLTGGGGNDVFKDTKANHNGDTITDFGPSYTILFTDATIASFSFTLSGHTLSYTGGSMTLNGVVAGKFTASAAASGGVQLTESLPHGQNDFSGDGRSDVLLRLDDGTVREWLGQSDGSFVGNIAHVNVNPGATWVVAGTGDFNGDGYSDILWRVGDTVREWLGHSDGSFADNAAVNLNPGPGVAVVGTGDFNGDGRSDVLLRLTDGTVREWLGQSDGSFLGNIAHVNVNPGAGWVVAGTGDFNGDGYSDILWRVGDAVREWLGHSDGSFADNAAVNLNPGPGVAVVGTGDFNGDGRSDVLLRLADGTVREWLGQSDGSFVGNIAHVNVNPGSGWHVVGTGDFNGDGMDDLLWRTSDGTVREWLGHSDGSFADNASVNLNPGPGVHVQDPFIHDPFGIG